jgi:hypothetical protein
MEMKCNIIAIEVEIKEINGVKLVKEWKNDIIPESSELLPMG